MQLLAVWVAGKMAGGPVEGEKSENVTSVRYSRLRRVLAFQSESKLRVGIAPHGKVGSPDVVVEIEVYSFSS